MRLGILELSAIESIHIYVSTQGPKEARKTEMNSAFCHLSNFQIVGLS